MMHKLSPAFLVAVVCTAAALAQVAAPKPSTTAESAATSAATTTTATSPVAWVYVSSILGTTGSSEVYGYSAAPNGALTALAGSPYAVDAGKMAVNGKYLFGSMLNNVDVNTYLIETDGALRYAATTDVLTPNKGCGSAGPLFLDHSGATLYNFDYLGGSCANNTFEAYGVVKSTGNLTFLGDAGDNVELNGALTFTANNTYAYGSDCYHFSPAIYGFKRNSNGSLATLNINPPYPKATSSWCPYLAAADPANHLAIPMLPLYGYGSTGTAYQLAAYSVDGAGNLTTTSTSATMPKVAVGSVTVLGMAPSGKLLAVGGSTGLQVFHFNGASPITRYTGPLTTSYIDEVRWDNANHLYAISQRAKKLWVFTVTPTGFSQAPGSPHTINTPLGVIVQPLPRY
ncbi:MAG: hypothetical protein JWM54_1421 [Acidobacteriaceae bacterium]|nr:hypothetical protein [Acidobacteriaceae bacterium]